MNKKIFDPTDTLFAGDDAAAYRALHDDITAVLKPQNITEQLLVDDYVDYAWMSWRLRRYRTGLQMVAVRRALYGLIEGHHDGNCFKDLIREAAANDAEAVAVMMALARPLEYQAILAKAYCDEIKTFERLERRIARAEQGRDSIRRELERLRARREKHQAAGPQTGQPQPPAAAA